MQHQYILVDKNVAPEIFAKVVMAKQYLNSGRAKTVNQAIESVKISRSAFYKYKDYVFAYGEQKSEKIFTLFFTLDDVTGILSEILNVLAGFGGNVLTINQNIPINKIANITISFTMENTAEIGVVVNKLKRIKGINKIEVLAME